MIRSLLERLGVEWIYGADGENESLYLLRIPLSPGTRWGGMYLHIFLRGDLDPDCHDHPWYFWTFPLVSYAEVVRPKGGDKFKYAHVVDSFRWHHRTGDYAHRVLGTGDRRIYTIVWHGPKRREWGFWVKDRWVPWRAYLYGLHDRS